MNNTRCLPPSSGPLVRPHIQHATTAIESYKISVIQKETYSCNHLAVSRGQSFHFYIIFIGEKVINLSHILQMTEKSG